MSRNRRRRAIVLRGAPPTTTPWVIHAHGDYFNAWEPTEHSPTWRFTRLGTDVVLQLVATAGRFPRATYDDADAAAAQVAFSMQWGWQADDRAIDALEIICEPSEALVQAAAVIEALEDASMPMLSDDELAAIRKRWSKITPGPWPESGALYGAGIVFAIPNVQAGGVLNWLFNRRAIAKAPEDVAALLAHIEALTEE